MPDTVSGPVRAPLRGDRNRCCKPGGDFPYFDPSLVASGAQEAAVGAVSSAASSSRGNHGGETSSGQANVASGSCSLPPGTGNLGTGLSAIQISNGCGNS